MGRTKIVAAIKAERARQDVLWGTQFDDKNTPNDWVACVMQYLSLASYDGRYEVYTVEGFIENMKKAATICVAAIEAAERNGGCAKRHYDR